MRLGCFRTETTDVFIYILRLYKDVFIYIPIIKKEILHTFFNFIGTLRQRLSKFVQQSSTQFDVVL